MTKPIILCALAAADLGVRFSPHCWEIRYALARRNNMLTDPWRIANFLDADYPNRPPLFGSDAQPLATFVDAWADAALLPQIARIVLVDIHNNIADADKPYFGQTRERLFGTTLEKVSSNRPELVRTLGTSFAPLRAILRSSSHLGGEKSRYVDYSVFGIFMWARCISDIELLQPDDPIHQWRDRLLDLFEGLGRGAPTVASSRFKSDETSR